MFSLRKIKKMPFQAGPKLVNPSGTVIFAGSRQKSPESNAPDSGAIFVHVVYQHFIFLCSPWPFLCVGSMIPSLCLSIPRFSPENSKTRVSNLYIEPSFPFSSSESL
ncbi:hypothetical protein SLE2022_370650 [Rubroshorea leprosula]